MQIEITNATTVHLKKAGANIAVDNTKFPANAQTHIWEYGIRQILNDAMSGFKADDLGTDAKKAEAVASAQKRLDSLYAGTLRAAKESDPILREAKKLAGEKVAAQVALFFKGEKGVAALAGLDKDAAKAKVEKTLVEQTSAFFKDEARMAPFMAQAKVNVEASAALSIDDLDINL